MDIKVVIRASSNLMESGSGDIEDNLGMQLIAFVSELLVMEGKNEGKRSIILVL